MTSTEKTSSSEKINTLRNLGVEATTEKNFCFISYNSDDCDRICEYAQRLNNEGIPLWYDRGLKCGQKWEKELGERIHTAKAFILFFTKGILEKEESYVEKEFRIAKNQKKDIYILMIDDLEDVYWEEYPGKSSFLDDIDQKQNCYCNSIEYLITVLKKVNSLTCQTKDLSTMNQNKKNLPFSTPRIVDSETLLNNGYFTAKELSQRHVELDLLTVDKKLFPDAVDIEGDADTWENMVVNTADCTANLVVKDRIVGYMDFIPVNSQNYELLQTQPFSDEYVEFYSFGGNFDVFVSMFSIDLNYAVPSNYKLFFQWMINRILDLRDSGVYIDRIGFSIYSKSQATMLERLGCKKILESKLKGFFYETRAKDLLNNELLLSNVIKNRISTYDIYTNCDKNIVSECKKIVEPLLAKNGGILQYENAVCDSDIIITAKVQGKIVGYVCLKKYDIFPNGIYIEQIAVEKKYQGFGIGKQLINNAIKYADMHNYSKIYANCQKINIISQSLFKNAKFINFDMTQEEYLGIGIEMEYIDKNYAFLYNIR